RVGRIWRNQNHSACYRGGSLHSRYLERLDSSEMELIDALGAYEESDLASALDFCVIARSLLERNNQEAFTLRAQIHSRLGDRDEALEDAATVDSAESLVVSSRVRADDGDLSGHPQMLRNLRNWIRKSKRLDCIRG